MTSAAITDRTTDTPRTDGEILEVVDAMLTAGPQWDFVVPAEFARKLERELAEAKKPPPCTHTQRSGRMENGKCEWWCQQCGKQMDSGYVTIDSLTVPFPIIK